jgi:DNA-binding NarL/FixJ family response regulator
MSSVHSAGRPATAVQVAQSLPEPIVARVQTTQTSVVFCLFRGGFAAAVQARMALTEDVRLLGIETEFLVGLDLIELVRPHVFVVDAQFIHEASEAALTRLRIAGKNSRILVYSMPDTARMVEYVIGFGIRGSLSRYCTLEQCLRAIRAVQAGELWLSRKVSSLVLDELLARVENSERPAEKPPQRLSQREAQIVEMLKKGLTDKEVGQALGISPATVKTHVEHVFDKMGISRRAQL